MAVPLRIQFFTALKFEKPLYALAAGDVTQDGHDEIVVGAEDGVVRVYKYERGVFEEIWSGQKYWQWVDQIILADVDQDYFDEILVIIGRQLIIYKYEDRTFKRVWEYEAKARIISVAVADSNNNKKKELLIGCNDGSLTVLAQKSEELYHFKTVWKRKLEGDVLVSVADVDADTLNEIVVANNNQVRVYRVIEKYPKKESWIHEFPSYIKKLLTFDLNEDKKAEIFLAMENNILRVFSHKDGNYFSEDNQYQFQDVIAALSPGKIEDKNLLTIGSYDGTLQGYRYNAKLFQIELYEKCFSTAFADVDNDGKPEILCGGNNLYVFKEEVILTVQMEYPISLLSEEELSINYYVKNNSQNQIYNIDFSDLDWTPAVLTLNGPKPKIPLIQNYGTMEVNFQFKPSEVYKVTPVTFPRYKVHFEMKNLQFSQFIEEMKIYLLPKFSYIIQRILKRCERLKGTSIPLHSLAHLMEKELGNLDYEIERIVEKLLKEKYIVGSLENRILYIRDLGTIPQEEIIITSIQSAEPSLKAVSPELMMKALKKTLEKKKRSSLSELANQFNVDVQGIENALVKLKSNFEITGFLIPNDEFIYLTLEEIDSLVIKVNQTPYIALQELEEQFGLSEQEIEHLINDLMNVGNLHGEIIEIDGSEKFITIKTLSETILSLLKKDGKLVISTYSRKSNIPIPTIREAIRSLLDSALIDGHYTYNGALFYTEEKLERDMLEFLQGSDTASIGILSITNQFQMSKDVITLIINNLVSKGLISGYILENTFFKKSYEEEKLRDLFNKYIDALNIFHILVTHRESGITVFSESYLSESTIRIDPALVSGMLHAITSFGSEITGVELAGLRLLEYKDFKIVMNDGELIRAALILRKAPSQRLFENLRHFVRFFDTHYRPHLQDFQGSIDHFSSASDLVDEYFEISLSFPHEVQEKEVFKNRERLSANELAIINRARGLGRQFLLKNLLEVSSKELLITQPEAFLTIYDLRDKKIFQVIAEARKWCPYCGSIILKTALTCPHCLRKIEDTVQ